MSDRNQAIEAEEEKSVSPVVYPGRTELKTKPVPIIIVLIAAGIACVLSVVQGADFSTFFKRLLLTVVIFGVISTFIKVYLDKIFNPKKKTDMLSEGENDGQPPDEGMESEENPEEPLELMDEQETEE